MTLHKQQKLPYLHLDRQWGLPSGQVHKLAITSNGDVWMATPAGLSHYDGVQVQTYTQKDGLGTHGLRTLYCPDGEILFVGTDVGLDKQLNNSYQFVSLIDAETWSYGFIECILSNKDASFWIGTASGLYLYKPATDKTKTSIRLYLHGYIKELLRTQNGEIWVLGKPFGLAKLDQDNISGKAAPFMHAINGIETMCIDARRPGFLLVGGDFGVKLIEQNGNTVEDLVANIPDSKVTCIYQYEDEIWLGTDNNLYVLNASNKDRGFTNHELKLALEKVQVSDIQADAYGNVWVASQKNGAYKFSFMRSMCIEYEDEELESVFSIRKNNKNINKNYDYLLATKTGIFTYSYSAGVKRYEPLSDFKQHIWDVHENTDGQIWLAAQSGLYLLDKHQRIRKIGHDHPVCRAPNRCLLEGEDGSVYLGTQGGIALINTNGMISEIMDSSFSGIGYVYTIESAPKNHLYVGTIGNGAWFGSLLGLKRLESEHIGKRDNVYSISRHANGNIIILSNNKVIHINNNGIERVLLETEHSIAGWCTRWNGEDRIWIGSSFGLFEVEVKSGEVLRNFKSLPGGDLWEFNFSESLLVSDHGELLCGLRGNFCVVDTRQIRDIRIKPSLSLKSHAWLNAEDLLITDQRIKAGKWTLQFDFSSNWAMDEENLLFRYRLVGFDENWSKLQKIRTIQFNSLPLGEYSLHVQAYSPLFGWGVGVEVLSFQVVPNSKLDNILSRFLQPVFNFKESFSGVWKNLGLQKLERRVDDLVEIKVSEFEHDKRELERENILLSKFSHIDALTGVANRRAFDDYFSNTLQQARRHKLQLSLILLDIDFFKAYNDNYGHIAGDDALRHVSTILQTAVRRAGDFLARYGGEEFAIVLPLSDSDSAQSLAKRIVQAMLTAKIEHLDQPNSKHLTCSMGVISIDFASSAEIEPRELIHAADINLYKAKNKGKNCYIASDINP